MDGREDHARISVESIQAWNTVRSNCTTALLALVDAQIEENNISQSERDALIAHVQQFKDDIFNMAKPNLRVNGRNYEDIGEEEVAVFDESLDRRIWSLSEQRMDFDREVAMKRRTRPQEVEALMHDLLQRQRAADEEDDPNADDLAEPDIGDMGLPDESILREAEASMAQVASLTQGLHQSIQTQLERVDRFKAAEAEIKALKS